MKRKTLALMVVLVFSISFCLSQMQTANSIPQTSNAMFSDEFSGFEVDSSKWLVQFNTKMSGNPAFGGKVTVENGSIALSSDGTGFPCVSSAINPFPSAGDFSLEFSFTYTKLGPWGNGFWVTNGPWVSTLSGSDSGKQILCIWAGNADGINKILAYMNGTLVYRFNMTYSESNGLTQIVRLDYINGVYTLAINDVEIASVQSDVRPDTIGFGHPPAYFIPFQSIYLTSFYWTSFQIDYIRLLQAQTGEKAISYPRPLQGQASKMTISSLVSTTQLGYAVDIIGTLHSLDEEPLSDANIILYYSIPGLPSWTPISSVNTDANGTFSLQWLPQSTGNFRVKAEWLGNDVYSGISAVQNISILKDTSKTLFFVESNSTLSGLAFNSTSNELSFTVSGSSGTSGYVKFMISKTLITNPTELTLYLDGQPMAYSLVEKGEAWTLCFEYHHSAHYIIIKIQNQQGSTHQPSTSSNSNNPFSSGVTYLLSIIAAIILLLTVTFRGVRTKRQRSASTIPRTAQKAVFTFTQ